VPALGEGIEDELGDAFQVDDHGAVQVFGAAAKQVDQVFGSIGPLPIGLGDLEAGIDQPLHDG
jgi:hypothetical protein